MVIEKILKQLTPERVKMEIEAIQKVELPPELQKWAGEYKKVGDRDQFVWRWAYSGWRIFILSCVDRKYQKSILINKTCNTILNVLVDDLADKRQNKRILAEALAIISGYRRNCKRFNSFSPRADQEYIALIGRIWNFIQRTIKTYPRYKDFKEIFECDYREFLNTINYSYLVNKTPNLINLTENAIFSPHNMQGMIGMTIDLMCSPKFQMKELGIFREIAWRVQQMAGIGNLMVTWEREIFKNDFTSGIFAYALENNIIHVDELKKGEKNKIIAKIKASKAEKYFLAQWESYYNEVDRLGKKIKSVDAKKILMASEHLLMRHLFSKDFEI